MLRGVEMSTSEVPRGREVGGGSWSELGTPLSRQQ
jgi:hypothetical protein